MSRQRVHGLAAGACVAALLLGEAAGAGAASRRLQWGPIEFVPSLTVGLRHHSNVYVAPETDTLRSDVSGLIIDLNGALNFTIRPLPESTQEQLEAKGLYLDAYYKPQITFFNGALSNIELGFDGIDIDPDAKPDLFKITHILGALARYQLSPTFAMSGEIRHDEPEVSAVDDRLRDTRARAGFKWLLSQRLALEADAHYRNFEEKLGPGTKRVNPLGTFTEPRAVIAASWQRSPTLRFIADYEYREREFDSDAFLPPAADRPPNDFNRDGIPDNRKDYTQWTAYGRVHKRFARGVQGQLSLGWVNREYEIRQFGVPTSDGLVGGGWFSSLLTERTRLQASAEYHLTDTIREVVFEDINTFTTDEIGAFTVINSAFGTVWSGRVLVDLVQEVSKRGDQLLFGFAYQRDDLKDQQGTANLFVRVVDEDGNLVQTPERVLCEGSIYCAAILPDSKSEQFAITGGYRYRMKDWLGLQFKVTWYDRTDSIDPTMGLLLQADGTLVPTVVSPADEIKTDYLSIAAGLVLNLRLF